MNKINNQFVCKGCKYSTLFHCDKFNKGCVSYSLNGRRYQICCDECIQNNGYVEGEKEKKENTKKAYFHLPGIENLDIFIPLIKFKQYYPEACYDGFEISEIYGAFSGAIWNGRTPNYDGGHISYEDIERIRDIAEELNISINLTWNNHLITGTDVYDRYCNAITEIFHDGKHAITVASEELFNYLKEKYPNFKYYQSVICSSNDTVGLSKKDERYDMFLWTRSLNNNWEELKKIPLEERPTIEFLCNDACTPICNRMVHYNIVNKCLKDRKRETEATLLGNYCTIDHDFMNYNTNKWAITIKPEDINLYLNEGYCHFKLCSRGDIPPALALKIAKYIVKPEFVDDAFTWMIHGLTQTSEEINLLNKGESNNDKD